MLTNDAVSAGCWEGREDGDLLLVLSELAVGEELCHIIGQTLQ